MKCKTKKLFALLLSLAMVFSLLAGYSSSGDEGKQNLSNEELLSMNEENLLNYVGSTGYVRDSLTIAFTGATSLTLEPMTIVAVIYLCMTFPLSKIVERFEKKLSSPNSYRNHKKTNASRFRALKNGGKVSEK